MVLQKLNTEIYGISHLRKEDSHDIDEFRIDNPKGKGLESYLRESALVEEQNNNARTYLIRDTASNELTAYFTLKSGLITQKSGNFSFDNLTGISTWIGAQYLYIFALPHNRLMNHYGSMGFQRLPRDRERFIHSHIRPIYDKGCIFMYQKIV